MVSLRLLREIQGAGAQSMSELAERHSGSRSSGFSKLRDFQGAEAVVFLSLETFGL